MFEDFDRGLQHVSEAFVFEALRSEYLRLVNPEQPHPQAREGEGSVQGGDVGTPRKHT